MKETATASNIDNLKSIKNKEEFSKCPILRTPTNTSEKSGTQSNSE